MGGRVADAGICKDEVEEAELDAVMSVSLKMCVVLSGVPLCEEDSTSDIFFSALRADGVEITCWIGRCEELAATSDSRRAFAVP